MLKYAKIIDPEKKLCSVGTGDPEAVYQRFVDPETGKETVTYVSDYYSGRGMKLMEVEQDHSGRWYVKGFAPASPEKKTVRTFSKFSIWVATRDLPVGDGSGLTVWQAFETFLHDENLWSGWNQLVDLVEDNPFFEQFYPLACEKLGKELVDHVLDASVTKTEQKTISK